MDDDIICLSSDEEAAQDLPKKKIKLSHESMQRPKIEQNADKDVIVCKRKIPETRLSDLFPTKKLKIINDGHIEEIVIVSPRKSVTTNANDWRIPTAELSAKVRKDGSEPSLARVVHDFFDAKEKSLNKAESVVNKSIKDSSISEKSALPSSKLVYSKDDNLTIASRNTVEASKTLNIRASGSSNLWAKISESCKGKTLKNENTNDIKSNTDVRKRSKSPEVQILPSVKTPKSATKNVQNNIVEKDSTKYANIQPRRISESSGKSMIETPKHLPNPAIVKKSNSTDTQQTLKSSLTVEKVSKDQSDQKVSPPMPRCLKINGAKGSNEVLSKSPIIKPSSGSPNSPKITNCEILTKGDQVSVPINGIVKYSDMSPSGKTNISEKSSNLVTQNLDSKPETSKVSVTVKRLIPQSVPRSPNVLDEHKLDNPETSVANGKKRESSNSPGSSSTEYFSARSSFGDKSSEVSESTRLSNDDSSKPRKLENKDDPPNFPEIAPKGSSNFFEPKPGCSKSPDPCDSPEKPQLIVKTVKPAYTVNQDTFSMFLGLLQQTDRGSPMTKVISKLKRYYDEMDESYARSREFEQLLNEKRERIYELGKHRVYVYAAHIVEEMKTRRKRRKGKKAEDADNREVPENVEEEPAVNEKNGEVESADEDEDSDEARRRRRTIKKIDDAMKKVGKSIKKLEEREVDWDEENNSSYIKLDRYKAKMIELWNKRCELTSEHADAGRPYLRPKHVRLTLIPSVDQAINSFVNSKLGNNRKKTKKGASMPDGIIFPDHVDILECIAKVNETQKLGLDKRKQEKLARQAFTQLGEYLQKVRQNDYWDTFSLDLDKGEDPATRDPELEEKLDKNQEINRARITQVFEEYANKQEEARAENQAENDDEEDEDEEEDDDEEEVDSNAENTDLELLDDGDENQDNHESEGDRDSIHEEGEENPKDEESTSSDVSAKSNERNNNHSPLLETIPESSKNTDTEDADKNEVHRAKDSKEETNEQEGEKRSLLRIRSFAKPPDSWQASQEQPVIIEEGKSKMKADGSTKKSPGKSKNIETIDVTEDDNIPPVSNGFEKQEKKLKTLKIDNRTVVVKPFDKNAIKAIPKLDLPKIILVSNANAGSTKNHSSIIVQSPTDQASPRININNLNNPTQTQRHLSVSSLTQPKHSDSLQQVTISRLPQQLGPIVKRLANDQFVRSVQQNASAPPNGVFHPRIPESIQVRPVFPQQQTKLSIAHNIQIPKSQLARLKNPHYYPASATPRSAESSQTNNSPKPILPVTNGQGIRLSEPGNSRVVEKTLFRRTAHMEVVHLRDGKLMAKSVIPQNPAQEGPQASYQSGVKVSEAKIET